MRELSTLPTVARLSIENLSKRFPVQKGAEIHAVEGLSLTVEKGELLVLVGPSGSGKTTTLRLIAGLDEPSGGTIVLDGQDLKSVPADQRDIAMVFQKPALLPQLSVYENLALGLKLRKTSPAETRIRVAEAVELLGLTNCLQQLPDQLSGGQQQRVALGRALVRRPRLFLLDEPLSSLDPTLRGQMRAEIARLQRQLGITMIFVTHDQTDAMILGHRIAVMREGRVQQIAPPMTVYGKPANQFVAGFIGAPAMNFLTGRLRKLGEGLVFESANGTKLPVHKIHASALMAQLEREMVLGVRPDYFSIGPHQDETIPGLVEWVEALGSESIVHVKAQETILRMRIVGSSIPVPGIGEALKLSVQMEQVSFFDKESGRALL
ncbi:MAG TPA: ABC transporter ATP-binding protein [Candidatus Saccharimonadales bacterium]|nr:ABC transporter ATP-binding protein [Candidatus Saccharimonadales bacterium]